MAQLGVVVTLQGELENLNVLTANRFERLKVGLFQNPLEADREITLAQIEVADFSGYDGLHDLIGWTSAVIQGEFATSHAQPKVWYHDGGLTPNWIFGAYIVDGSGNLQWVERAAELPQSMHKLGDIYVYTPRFSVGSRFPPL